LIVLVDSCAWIEYFQGSSIGEKVRCYVEDDQEIIVSAINMAEIYRWILRFYNQNIAEEKRNAIKDRCIIIDVDEEIAIDAARIKHNLGWGLGDSIIYATAKHENAMVLTCDSHFQGQESVIFLGRELNIFGQR
jgi:predicted nucleic acid-binding protein